MGSKTKSYTGKVDFTYDWSGFGSESTLHFGGQYDDRKSVDPGASALIRPDGTVGSFRSEEHTSELQSLMRSSYAVFFLQKTNDIKRKHPLMPLLSKSLF